MFFTSVPGSHSENTGPVTSDHVKYSQMRNETPLQLWMKSMLEQV